MIYRNARIVGGFLTALVFLLVRSTWAADNYYTGNGGSWSAPGDWSLNHVPITGEAVFINVNESQPSVNHDYTGPPVTLATLKVESTKQGLIVFSIGGNLSVAADETLNGNVQQLGGVNSANRLIIGNDSLINSTYSLVGGSLIVDGATSSEYVGNNGNVAFLHNGGTNSTRILYIAAESSSDSIYDLTGGSLTASQVEYVGYAGVGTFAHTGGTNVTHFDLDIGALAGSTGHYSLGGTGALTADRFEYIGDLGTGTFTQTGGTNSAGSNVYLGAGGSGVGTYNQSGGTNSAVGNVYVGYFGIGTYSQSGGSNVSGGLQLGFHPGSSGTYTLSGTGSLTVDGGELIGSSGRGTFSQTGGTHTIAQRLYIGTFLGSTGTYNLSGGTLTASAVRVGGNDDFAAGTGVLSVSGTGVLNVNGALRVYDTPGSAINLSSGIIIAESLDTTGAHSHFNWTGGTLRITGGGGIVIGGSGPLGNLVLTSAISLAVTNTTTVSSGSSLFIEGGTSSSGVLNNAGSVAFNSDGFTVGAVTNSGIAAFNFFGTAVGMLTNSGSVGFNANGITVKGDLTNQSGGVLTIGQNCSAQVNGALVNSGEIQLGGGAAGIRSPFYMLNNGLIRGDGSIMSTINASTGEIRAESGKRLSISGMQTNVGRIVLQGGMVEVSTSLPNAAAGRIIGRGIIKTGGEGLVNAGTVSLSGGDTEVFGKVKNITGSASKGITIANDTDVTFWDDVTNTSGLFKVNAGSSATFFGAFSGNGTTGGGMVNFEGSVSPGASAAAVTFDADTVLGGASTLSIELAGLNQGTEFDHVNVVGSLVIEGVLNVSLLGAFTPAAGNSFDILDWGTVSGAFSSIVLPTLGGGLNWNTAQLYANGVVSVVSVGVPGDYNNNGVVDAADYVAWRKGGPLANQVDDPSMVNAADYTAWRARFGNPDGSGSGGDSLSQTGVPEPTTLPLLMLSTAVWCIRRPGRIKTTSINA